MSEYVSNSTVQQIAQRIGAAKKIVLTAHVKPDGDALGAVLALQRGLTARGQNAEIWLMGPLEPNLRTLAAHTPLHFVEDRSPPDDCDLVIVADTGAWSQLRPLEPWIKARFDDVIVVDHHVRGDDVGAMRLEELRPAVFGVGVGLGAAFFGGRVMEAVLFGVQPRDPLIFGATGVLLLVVALAATVLPAYRASQVDPVEALRAD